MSHAHAFFMHTYLLFSILLILICAWYFSVCLSPSLSFFRLVCSMASKKSKSTPSWNSLSSWASTSDSTPSLVRFRDEKAHTDFSENFSWCGIHLECRVVLSDFFDTDLPTIIYNRGCFVASRSLVLRDHTWVLLQYARIWLLCTLFHHSCSRYIDCSHSGSYIRGATCSEGRDCWLPRLWLSSDCVQR